ncbi:Usp family protein [Williamsia sp. 1138]|uniref:universal stress protein n=1 Tax=Williamsia sp. 1138 TaxID=1903117 RepID=UPI000A0F9E07|nr:universal stress protein [Williamsia sp. 1138]OZG29583.1 Usp family protein [Williamsia sp. 1138]
MTTHAPTVVGVDGSSTALDAVRWAALDAALHHSDLLLISSTLPPVDAVLPGSYYQALREQADSALIEAEAMARRTVSAELDISTIVVSRSPIPMLIELSATARMIVVGSRGIGVINRAILGSVSAALASHTRAPLTVVRGWSDDAQRRSVVVGTDGSAASTPALEIAFDEAAARGVGLTAVHAWSDADFALVHATQGVAVFDWATRLGEAERVLEKTLGELRLKYPNVKVRRAVVRDRPVQALLDHAQAAQLVVVGSHGRGGFAGMLLGSTSRKVLHNAHNPVMIVPSHH